MKVSVRRVEKARPVEITTEYIKLESLLKLADLTASGGEAKLMIQEGQVRVNGAVCTQRGKKLRPGDRVLYQGALVEITAPQANED